MEDRKIIELYNYRSENALIETDKKYGKIVTFLICKLIKNTLDVEECKLCLNGMPVPLLRNCYSIFNGTKYR